jgi:ribosomal protein S18 acetylase RimI-like enzyme
VLLAFPSIMGVRDALRSYAGVLRGLLTVTAPPAADDGQIHSVVVDADARGEGAGTVLMEHLENQAALSGKDRATLQVLTSNSTARAFYRARGYAEVGPAHGRLRTALAFPSMLMHKDIGPEL